mmetsp:Transcript_10424/g.15826  ORF Transcript_10424/g.15826 Transcript_10424/m.15826 type:complete len:171 (+) Transcript_10424:134-646(+)|eukprot:CAMPEP_0196133032 /NCGR_PEP_ID=MMETSP0910-20130528/2423_1 /TAXON_ID=49265 /ORGANISM="Thalassiosira rotula, Strain GSO102" /LENGTH=170 /DNA_ID=CAMNT_0041392711 /DNA_START=102 /DNA_END=614 /DNA_ORIENTATION=+
MPGQLVENNTNWEHEHRWKPVNTLKNSRLTLQIHCPDSGKRLNVPEKANNSLVDLQSYFDEAPVDNILGSTTLHELIKKVKKDIPSLYLWDEVGGATLSCGPHTVHKSDWETTMIWELICDDTKGKDAMIPHTTLEDGREAVVVTIGVADAMMKRPSTVQRCLAKGDVYG